jgi:predicted ATPase
VLIEDIHWADEQMVRIIDALARRSEGSVLLLATARPEFIESNSGFGAGSGASVVALRPLTEQQSETLISELLGTSNLPSALIDEIGRKAEGNPFFVEELIQRLIEEHALTDAGGQWQATERATDVKLPDTIHALLAARIDALPSDEKGLIQEAAVVGRTFWPGALAASSDPAAADVLMRLERRGLVATRQTSTIADEPEYIFRHVLIRDVAYSKRTQEASRSGA